MAGNSSSTKRFGVFSPQTSNTKLDNFAIFLTVCTYEIFSIKGKVIYSLRFKLHRQFVVFSKAKILLAFVQNTLETPP